MTNTRQPSWHCVANLGDADPLNHGGTFIAVDRRGNYCPELWILDATGHDIYGDPTSWRLHTVLMEPCTFYRDGNGDLNLSDNPYHPLSRAWFAGRREFTDLASFIGEDVDSLARLFLGDLMGRATAWRAVHDYHGPQSDAETLTKREAEAFCRRMLAQIKKAEALPDGCR